MKGVLLKIADSSAGIESAVGSNVGPSNWKCRVGLHRWARWEQYERELNVYSRRYPGEWQMGPEQPIKTYEEWEKRDCLRCGARHRRIVRGEVRVRV